MPGQAPLHFWGQSNNPGVLIATANTFTTIEANVGNTGTLLPRTIIGGGVLQPGQVWRWRAWGTYSTSATTFQLGLAMGPPSTTAIGAVPGSLGNATANGSNTATAWPWRMEGDIVVLTTGAGTAATVKVQGLVLYGTALTTFAAAAPIPNVALAASSGFDSTVNQGLAIVATMGASAAGNIVVCHHFSLDF